MGLTTAFILYLLVEGKFAATIHSQRFETRELCVAAIPQLRAAFPAVKGGLCIQAESELYPDASR